MADPPLTAHRGSEATAAPRLAPTPFGEVAWLARWRTIDIPILAATADAIEQLRAHEDDVDAHLLGELIGTDPLATLKLMAYAASHRPPRLLTDTESVTTTLVLMGIGPFFRAFGPQACVEDLMDGHPEALRGLQSVLLRARRAARFATGFALHRNDPDTAVIHQAALLHDFAEMLLWCDAPGLALQIQAAQRADPRLRSADIQRRLLGIDLVTLQQSLMKSWRLPELLVQIVDDHLGHLRSVRTVMLAVRLSRHLCTDQGWHNAALPDDVADVAEMLGLSAGTTLKLLRSIDED